MYSRILTHVFVWLLFYTLVYSLAHSAACSYTQSLSGSSFIPPHALGCLLLYSLTSSLGSCCIVTHALGCPLFTFLPTFPYNHLRSQLSAFIVTHTLACLHVRIPTHALCAGLLPFLSHAVSCSASTASTTRVSLRKPSEAETDAATLERQKRQERQQAQRAKQGRSTLWPTFDELYTNDTEVCVWVLSIIRRLAIAVAHRRALLLENIS